MHIPVLLEEVIKFLEPQPGDNFIDGTLGDGGHAEAILERTAPDGKLLGLDLDEKAINTARERLARFGERLVTAQKNFRELKFLAKKINFPRAKGILLDLGLRSAELEESGRGFTFAKDEPLDMRFGGNEKETAANIVNTWSEAELERVFREYGEERLSREIARALVEQRRVQPIVTTLQFAETILAVYRRKLKSKKEVPWIGGIHPATKVFQALRIAVNDELENLRAALNDAPELLAPGGRLAVISFHSLEDRIVKRAFRTDERLTALTKKPVTPSEEGVEVNPRSRSAKLRVAELA